MNETTRESIQQPARAGSSIITILIVLLVLLGLFWLAIAGLQLAAGSISSEFSGAGFYGILNLIVGISCLALITDVSKRRKRAAGSLTLLGLVGAVSGLLQLFDGAWILVCAIPLYGALGVLVYTNKDLFYVQTAKEVQEAGTPFLGKFEIALIVIGALILIGAIVFLLS